MLSVKHMLGEDVLRLSAQLAPLIDAPARRVGSVRARANAPRAVASILESLADPQR